MSVATLPDGLRPRSADHQFLDLVTADGPYRYYWTLHTDGTMRTAWWNGNGRPPIPNTDNTNIYFGVHGCSAIPPTNTKGDSVGPEHVRAQLDYIASAACLYAEFDFKDFVNSPQITRAHIGNVGRLPSALVASGGGYHGYWLFDTPRDLSDPSARADFARVQEAWVSYVGGDTAAKDLCRVLRVPGTLNYKYDPPRPVELIEFHPDRRYTYDELAALVPAPAPTDAIVHTAAIPSRHRQSATWAQERIDYAITRVKTAGDGHKHDELRDMARLIGGLPSDLVDELTVTTALLAAVQGRAMDMKGAAKTIVDGIGYGKASPLPIPEFPTDQPLLIINGRACCPSCDTPIERSRYDYPRTSVPGWYCRECRGQMKWPFDAVTSASATAGGDDAGTDGAAAADEGGLPLLLHATNLDAVPPTAWLIPGMMAQNKLSMIFAPAGSGKSFITLDQALCIAQKAPVVYIAAEAVEDYQERVAAWCAKHGRGQGQLYFWTRPIALKDPASIAQFLAGISQVKPAAIIIDPLAACMVGLEESSTGDMTIAVDALNWIRRATRAAVHIVHHTGWDATHERGSSALRAACRIVMKLATDEAGLMTMSCAKANNGKPFDARFFRLVSAADSVVPVPTHKISTRGAPLSERQREVIEALDLVHFRDGASFSQIHDHLGVAKSTVNQAINVLVTEGYVDFEGTRQKQYRLTDKGRVTLKQQQLATMISANGHVHIGDELDMNWEVNYSEHEDFSASQSQVHIVHTESAPVHMADDEAVHTSSLAPASVPARVHTSSYPVHTEFISEFTSSPHAPPLRGAGSEQANSEPPIPKLGTLTVLAPSATYKLRREIMRLDTSGPSLKDLAAWPVAQLELRLAALRTRDAST